MSKVLETIDRRASVQGLGEAQTDAQDAYAAVDAEVQVQALMST